MKYDVKLKASTPVLRLFNDDSVVRGLDAKFEQVQAFLARENLDGVREFLGVEKAKLEEKRPGN
jgi:hypothetical protein